VSPILRFFIHLIAFLFIAGMLGSAVVILMSGIEDIHSIFQPDEPEPGPPRPEA
jgi:hypothetical protein